MKPLDLKFGSIKEMLTKDQMKLISGGSCVFYWSDAAGCAGAVGVHSSIVAGSTGDQAGSDNNCNSNDCCDDVNCTD
jgi:hypothetical protein